MGAALLALVILSPGSRTSSDSGAGAEPDLCSRERRKGPGEPSRSDRDPHLFRSSKPNGHYRTHADDRAERPSLWRLGSEGRTGLHGMRARLRLSSDSGPGAVVTR